MTPITNKGTDWRTEAKQGGWKQVKQALEEFEGEVVRADFGAWSADKEYLEIETIDNIVLKCSEDLDMNIAEKFTFRINCSDGATSFWVANFLEAADNLKLLIPEDLVGKRIKWAKVEREYNINGQVISTSNFVPAGIGQSQSIVTPQTSAQATDPIEEMLELAVGKTERQFRTALALNPKFANTEYLTLAKMGAVTQGFLAEGKLVLDGEYYWRPNRKP